MSTITSRIARGAVMAALVGLAATACGGGAAGGAGDSGAKTNGSSAASSNGLETKSAAQVQRDASGALKGAKSVHVTGTMQSDGKSLRIDVRIQGNSSTGTIVMDGSPIQITVIGGDTYIKGDQRAWVSMGAGPLAPKLADRWAKLGSQPAAGAEGMTIGSLAAEMIKNDTPLLAKVERAELDGRRVVVLSQQDGSKLYVANTGPAYPLRLHAAAAGKDTGQLDFTEYGTDFQITAPSGAVDIDKLG